MLVVTPGPATATVLRVAARDGRRAATSAILGNSAGVLVWASLSAVGISSLVLASELAYDALRVGGAVVLVLLGLRSLLAPAATPGRRAAAEASRVASPAGAPASSPASPTRSSRSSSSPSSRSSSRPTHRCCRSPWRWPRRSSAFELLWYSLLAFAVVRAGNALRPAVQRRVEQGTGAIMVALGLRLAREAR